MVGVHNRTICTAFQLWHQHVFSVPSCQALLPGISCMLPPAACRSTATAAATNCPADNVLVVIALTYRQTRKLFIPCHVMSSHQDRKFPDGSATAPERCTQKHLEGSLRRAQPRRQQRRRQGALLHRALPHDTLWQEEASRLRCAWQLPLMIYLTSVAYLRV